jgi:hypothetical protein
MWETKCGTQLPYFSVYSFYFREYVVMLVMLYVHWVAFRHVVTKNIFDLLEGRIYRLRNAYICLIHSIVIFCTIFACLYRQLYRRFGIQLDRRGFRVSELLSIAVQTVVCWCMMSHHQTPSRHWTIGMTSSWFKPVLVSQKSSRL